MYSRLENRIVFASPPKELYKVDIEAGHEKYPQVDWFDPTDNMVHPYDLLEGHNRNHTRNPFSNHNKFQMNQGPLHASR